MGTSYLSKQENDGLRSLINGAVASGKFLNLSEVARHCGLSDTILYPPMRDKKRGFGAATAATIRKSLEGTSGGGTKTRKTNGHANGHVNGHTNGHAPTNTRLELTRTVLEKLFELRETTDDETVRSQVDALVADWASQGLNVIASAAMRPSN